MWKYVYKYVIHTSNIHIIISKVENRILHSWIPYINCWDLNYIFKHRLLVKGVKICIYTCQNRKWWNFAKIISGAHLHYKWILHTKFGSNRTVRFRRVERTDGRTDVRTDGRTYVERRPCHKGISYNRSCTKKGEFSNFHLVNDVLWVSTTLSLIWTPSCMNSVLMFYRYIPEWRRFMLTKFQIKIQKIMENMDRPNWTFYYLGVRTIKFLAKFTSSIIVIIMSHNSIIIT